MAWRDNLVQASFRGAEFGVDESENKAGGRRIALHEYPGRDDPFAEDMGEITKTFSIEGFIVGDDYLDRRPASDRRVQHAWPGELVHPYRGSRNVVCNEIVEAVRTREGTDRALHDVLHAGRRKPISHGRREYGGHRAVARRRGHPADHRAVHRRVRALGAKMEYECSECSASLAYSLVFRSRATGELMHGVGYSPSRIHPFARYCGPVVAAGTAASGACES